MKPPSVYLLNTLLRKQGIQRDALRLATACSRHPLPHSIRALSDTLDELQVPNLVCKLEFEQLAEIDGAYIVAAGKTEYPFYLVEKRDRSGRKFCLRTCSGRRLEVPKEWFRSAWDGTVLLAEKGDASNEIPWFAYWFKQLLAFLDRTAVYWFAGLFVLLLGLGLLLKPLGWEDLRYPVKMLGCAVSLLVIAKSSFNPHLAQSFCRLGKHADCNAVFQSAGAKLFGWISLGELSLAYFATSLFWGLFLAENPAALFRWLDVLAIPFVVYSLGWQIRHRRWCTLCLAIDAVLLADFGVELFFGPDKVVERGLWIDEAGYCVVFACMVLGIRRSVTQAEMAVEMPRLLALREHLLSDSDLFELQLARCREEPVRSGSASPLHNGVESGRTVTVVMNPSCPKCARVHRQLGLLGDCRVELLFAVNDGDHLSNDAALLIITTWITKGWAEADRQIGIWYERREMIVRTKIHPQAISILQAHRSYCQAVGIEGTPTVLVDNRRLPDTYDVEDLKYLF